MDKPLPPGVRKKGKNIFKVSQEYLKEDLQKLKNQKISKEKAKGYLMGDAYGNRGKMDYEPTPRYKHGGDVAGCGCASCMGESSVRGAGAAIRGTKFSGVK